jgi:uncharacterized protein YjbI with pentapeptide repeats
LQHANYWLKNGAVVGETPIHSLLSFKKFCWKLQATNRYWSTLIDVQLIGVQLIGVQLIGVQLIGVQLIGVQLIGVQLMGVQLIIKRTL